MEVFLGVAAAEGIGIGSALVIPDVAKRIIPQEHIEEKDREAGWARLVAACGEVQGNIQRQLESLEEKPKRAITAIADKMTRGEKPQGDKQRTGKSSPAADSREVLETYMLMLRDSVFFDELKAFYNRELCRIEYAIASKAEEYAGRLRSSGNDYLSERAQDITDIFGRVVDTMLGVKPFDMSLVSEGDVVIASTLNATDMIEIAKHHAAGIVLSTGGAQSHVAILSRGYGIPCVVGVKDINHRADDDKGVCTGETVIVDGMKGEVIYAPDEATLEAAAEKAKEEAKRRRSLKGFKAKTAVTKDGEKLRLFANIGTVEEAEKAREEGAEGIGLFRTEFLYMSDIEATAATAHGAHAELGLFSENSQMAAYKKVLTLMKGKPVTIRTLDAGGDKVLRPTDALERGEKNPLMGLRAVRLSLKRPKMLRTQLRALYRASIYGDLRIMFPLITDVGQVRECKAIAAEARASLHEEGVEIRDDVPLGIMVETASAAITSDILAKECDFFSLGTNDLTQYTLSVDRENDAVSDLYDETNIAVLRLIDMTVRNAKEAGIDLCVCGEMAGRADTITLLAGLGVRTLSMAPSRIAEAKELLLHYTTEELKAAAAKRLSV